MTAPLLGQCRKVEVAFAPTDAAHAYIGSEAFGAVAGATARYGSWGRLPAALPIGRADVPDIVQIDGASAGGQVITLTPRADAGGSVQAISIAPDSPVDAVWLHVGGERHLIAPGAPFIGDLAAYETAIIVPLRTLPDLTGLTIVGGSTDDTRTQFYSDFATTPGAIGKSGGVVTGVKFIARLNLYRGNARPLGLNRGPLAAQVAWSTDTANGISVLNDAPCLYACVLGRRCFDALVQIGTLLAGSGNCTVDVDGLDADIAGGVNSFVTPGSTVQITSLIAAQAITGAGSFAYRYEGTPFTAVRLRVNMATGGKAIGISQINAWDQRSQ